MSTRLTILVKGLILIAIPLFFQLVFIALVAKMRLENTDAEEWTIHTKDVMAQAQRCRVRILSAHGAIQGFILTRDPSYEKSLQKLINETPIELRSLKSLVLDRKDQSLAAEQIEREAVELMRFMSEGQRFVHEGRMDSATASHRRQSSQVLLTNLEFDFEKFLAFEKNLDQERHEHLMKSWSRFDALLAGGVVTSIVFTLAMAVLFARNISGRIAILTENARRLAESRELTPLIKGADEIARLDQVFHDMARTLSDSAIREREHASLLEKRAEELALVNAQLEEKARENEMFVYSVSHDLRSPLVNLQGFSKELQLIGGDLRRTIDKQEIPPEIRRQVQTMIEIDMGESITFIQTAVTRLSSIIDALLRLSRAGRVEYRIQRVEVETVVERVVSALRGTIEERKATIKVRDLPPASGDPTVIEQVFANLIGNALNYLDKNRPGQIEIFSVEADEQTPANCVVYAVKDNGLGIADQYKSKIFSAFQRLHGDVAKGEGVGLALVRRMVERHGGRVWFESEPGKGTTFFVAFQADIPEVEPTEPIIDEASPLVSMRTGNGRT
jgi:signal transduction histidine kinase